ncbi:MAG: tyrosine-type recombinase/integrase [Oscillospiraceae bacterium]|nr:tyrosine-type recombinase/integrase [Oscillospiraceae bacterium]
MFSACARDVYDFDNLRPFASITLTEKKTKKTKTIAVNHDAASAISLFMRRSRCPDAFLFENPNTKLAISRVQAYRVIRAAAEAINLQFRVSCHSLRKTFGYHAWKSGVSPVVIMEIYNHSSFAVTRRYLGVSQDDKDEVYRSLAFS